MRNKYIKSSHIDASIATIQRGDFSDYKNAAAEFKCDRGALSRRIRGLTKSKKEANSFGNSVLLLTKRRFLLIESIFLQSKTSCQLYG